MHGALGSSVVAGSAVRLAVLSSHAIGRLAPAAMRLGVASRCDGQSAHSLASKLQSHLDELDTSDPHLSALALVASRCAIAHTRIGVGACVSPCLAAFTADQASKSLACCGLVLVPNEACSMGLSAVAA